MKLRELQLKNFRCFENLTVNFTTDYTVLIGINGSGKSAILDAIRIFLYSWVEPHEFNIVENPAGFFYYSHMLQSDVRHKAVLNGIV